MKVMLMLIYILFLYLTNLSDATYMKKFVMPGAVPTYKDAYLCTAMQLNATVEEWVIKFNPLASANRAHHMLLFGCSDVDQNNMKEGVWDCGHHGVCIGNKILFAWAKNAPSVNLPKDVGFRIGGETDIKYLTLQIHYANPIDHGDKDHSGLAMEVTTIPQKYKAGIYLLAASYVDIPPHTERTVADMNCRLSDSYVNEDLYLFAFRTHAHKLSTVISGYKYDPDSNEYTEIAKGNPQWPQAFYPMKSVYHIKPSDILHARCTWNSSESDKHTHIGSTSNDEMCNLYLMFYTDIEKGVDGSGCFMQSFKNVTVNLPYGSDIPLPPNPELEELAQGENKNKDKEINYASIFDEKAKDASQHINMYRKEFLMNGATPATKDSYLCSAMRLNSSIEEWVVRYDPLASANRAHHMLLFGCSGVHPEALQKGVWDCGHHGVCLGSKIIFAWAKNAPSVNLPKDVGFRIGGDSDIRYLTLQIHYANPLDPNEKDYSGLAMEVTTTPQKYKAGIYLLATGYVDIPPHTERTVADINCKLSDTGVQEDINLFAFRTHAHKLSTVISGYKYDLKNKKYTQIAIGNPHWPQAFYPTKEIYTIKPSDVLHARCTWNSSQSNKHTYIGSTSDDEMCNLYLMYYTDVQNGPDGSGCGGQSFIDVTKNLPYGSDIPLPPNPELEEQAQGENKNKDKEINYRLTSSSNKPDEAIATKNVESIGSTSIEKTSVNVDSSSSEEYGNYETSYSDKNIKMDKKHGGSSHMSHSQEYIRQGKQLKQSEYFVIDDWIKLDEITLGQVVAVSLDIHENVVILHRGSNVWNGQTFRGNLLVDQTNSIKEWPVLRLDKNSGIMLQKWGQNMFFMPHGLTVDSDDNVWITDVGLHQVFKFASNLTSTTPLLTLGKRFQPGSDLEHFCKPTAVAVMKSGDFFISDGYCNARIIKYSRSGKRLLHFGEASSNGFVSSFQIAAPSQFRVPHGLTLAEDKNEVCVADRENGRIQCFDVSDGKFTQQFDFDEWGGRLFSLAYSPADGGKLFAVNGPYLFGGKVEAYEVDFSSRKLISSFSPHNQGLNNPHDVAVTGDGKSVYVVEISPNKVWKFSKGAYSNLHPLKLSNPHSNNNIKRIGLGLENAERWSTAGIASVILGLLAIPVIVLTTLSFLIRAKHCGGEQRLDGIYNSFSLNGKYNGKLNIGSILNKHSGFKRLATKDFDHDLESEDSDIEEFSLIHARA